MASSQDIGESIMREVAGSMSDEEYALFTNSDLARHTDWLCKDGWVVSYTTGRIYAGRNKGKFAVALYAPRGKGARSGNAKNWERTYYRTFSTRKAARKRAEVLYDQHMEKARAAK